MRGADVPEGFPARALATETRTTAAAPHPIAAPAIDVGVEVFVRRVLVVIEVQVVAATVDPHVAGRVLDRKIMHVARAHVEVRDEVVLGALALNSVVPGPRGAISAAHAAARVGREHHAVDRVAARDDIDAEVREAARLAGALDFIESQPRGFLTGVGERGSRLSGGQRQRISIARAFLKNAPILILDEATSALDTDTERSIQQSLALLMKGRTTLIVAHRFSTIRDVDRVLVFDGGRIVADGSREELYKSSELFRRLWDNQAKNLG